MPRFAFALLALVVFSSCRSDVETSETAETPEAILGQMTTRYDANRGGVDGFVVTGGGAEATHGPLPAEAAELDPPAIAPLGSTSDPEVFSLLAVQVPNVRLLARALHAATLDGPRDVRGTSSYVLTAPPDSAGAPSLRVVVDAETFDVREIEQRVVADTLERPLVTTIRYDDFRTADGLTLPYRVRQTQTGVDQLIPEAQRMIMGGQLGLAQEQLKAQPPSVERDRRRATVERQLRLYTQGIQEADLGIERVQVTPRAQTPTSTP